MYVSSSPSDSRGPVFLTIPDVARLCQVSTKTVRRWIRNGELVGHRLGSQWRIEHRDLDTFLKLRRTP